MKDRIVDTHYDFHKTISGFAHNSNIFREFVANMFYIVFQCQVFVHVNT